MARLTTGKLGVGDGSGKAGDADGGRRSAELFRAAVVASVA